MFLPLIKLGGQYGGDVGAQFDFKLKIAVNSFKVPGLYAPDIYSFVDYLGFGRASSQKTDFRNF